MKNNGAYHTTNNLPPEREESTYIIKHISSRYFKMYDDRYLNNRVENKIGGMWNIFLSKRTNNKKTSSQVSELTKDETKSSFSISFFV